MKLPNAHLAVIEREKITEYLLNGNHPDNGGKAAFFEAQGFSSDKWQVLSDALRKSAELADIVEVVESPHGSKYILDVRIETPGEKRPLVRTVWIIDRGLSSPRLITAYPREN